VEYVYVAVILVPSNETCKFERDVQMTHGVSPVLVSKKNGSKTRTP